MPAHPDQLPAKSGSLLSGFAEKAVVKGYGDPVDRWSARSMLMLKAHASQLLFEKFAEAAPQQEPPCGRIEGIQSSRYL